MRLYWFLTALFLATLLCGIHIYALQNFSYWKLLWLDIPMHLLGGLTIATLLVASLSGEYRFYLFTIAFVAIVIGWEIFEFMIGAPQPNAYALDTFFDLTNDSIGALVVLLFARNSLWKTTTSSPLPS